MIFSNIVEEHELFTNNPQVQIYPSKSGNKITFKVKTEYTSQILTPESMQSFWNKEKQ